MRLVTASRLRIVVLLIAAGTLDAAAADDDGEAKRHAATAAQLREAGQVREACQEFELAYALRATPAVIFGLAECNQLLLRYDRAAPLLDELLGKKHRRKLSAGQRAEAIELRKEARRILAAQSAESRTPSPEATREREPAPAPAPPAPPPAAPVVPAPTVEATAPRLYRLLFFGGIGVAAAGAAALIVGIGVGARSLVLSRELAQNLTWSAASTAAQRQGQAMSTAANALYAVGGLLAAAGAVAAIIGWRRGGAEKRVAVGLLPGALVVAWRF